MVIDNQTLVSIKTIYVHDCAASRTYRVRKARGMAIESAVGLGQAMDALGMNSPVPAQAYASRRSPILFLITIKAKKRPIAQAFPFHNNEKNRLKIKLDTLR